MRRTLGADDRVDLMHIVISHLRLRDPVADATLNAASEGVQLVASAEDANRIARDVGGPWMRENITPLLAGDTERSVGKVIASAEA